MVEIKDFAGLCAAVLECIVSLLPEAPEGVELPVLKVEFPQRQDAGDLTVRLFALAKPLRSNPAKLAAQVAEGLPAAAPFITTATAAGGYLNMTLDSEVLFTLATRWPLEQGDAYGTHDTHAGKRMVVEYASPNTNKPLHLGHIRNITLGSSVARLLAAVGYDVVQANLVNDRGIHICKSMLAYAKTGNGETPESAGLKGDHLVGRYYVAYDAMEKQDESILDEAREMLRKWEDGDAEVRALWQTMNDWVLSGFDKTFARLGVAFDRVDLESQTYQLGSNVVDQGLQRGIFVKDDDSSVWLDLEDIGLDRKIFRRSDGTSVYITQDVGTAIMRQTATEASGCIYVVGNEQEYHFKVLFEALKRLQQPWADNLHHLSYGMVTLPHGKMKSREGTTVDADDLMDEVLQTEKALLAEEDIELDAETMETIAQGALKFFLLKFTPRKGFQFDPKESVKLTGDTGPYVQYMHTRVASLGRKAIEKGINVGEPDYALLGAPEERALAKLLIDYPRIVHLCADKLSPSPLCGWLLEISRAFSRFWQEHKVLNAESPELVGARLALAQATAVGIRNGLALLGIGAPERM